MLGPPCFDRQSVPALGDFGQSIPEKILPKNLQILAGMLCPYSSILWVRIKNDTNNKKRHALRVSFYLVS